MSISEVQQALAEGALLIGELLGVGGDTWIVARGTGDGITSSPVPAPIGTWSGRVKRSKATQQAPLPGVLPGGTVGVTEFHALGTISAITPIAPGPALTLADGDILESQADSTLRFRIGTPYVVAGYVRYILEQL